MAGDTAHLLHDEQDDIPVAIKSYLFNDLIMARLFAFAPQALP